MGAARVLQAQRGHRVPEGAAAAQGAQDRRDLEQEELPKQSGAEDLTHAALAARCGGGGGGVSDAKSCESKIVGKQFASTPSLPACAA